MLTDCVHCASFVTFIGKYFSFIDTLERPLQVAVPVFVLSVSSLLLLFLPVVRKGILPSELIFFALLGALFGFFFAVSPENSFAQLSAGFLAIVTFFVSSLLRTSRLAANNQRLDAIYLLGVVGILMFIVSTEYFTLVLTVDK